VTGTFTRRLPARRKKCKTCVTFASGIAWWEFLISYFNANHGMRSGLPLGEYYLFMSKSARCYEPLSCGFAGRRVVQLGLVCDVDHNNWDIFRFT
jgi:hypothetical protein